MLALELRSKEALERENKRLLARVANLQEELKDKPISQGPTRSDTDQQVIIILLIFFYKFNNIFRLVSKNNLYYKQILLCYIYRPLFHLI